MPAFEGGAPTPVTTGGSGRTEQRAAVPVYVVQGRAPKGQRARRVTVVTSGPVEGGAAIPVYDAGNAALYTDDPALPVYVVSGTLGSTPFDYTNKVVALGPIAYWPLADASGSTATDESGNGRNGAYSNVTLGAAGIGDGRTAASFNGSTGTVNIHSASFAGAFDGQECTVALWFKVDAAGVWTDASVRKLLHLFSDGSNRVILQKTNVNNQVNITYIAGGTNDTIPFVTAGQTGWLHLAATISKTSDELKLYFNGAQQGSTAGSLGTYAGALTAANQRISGTNATPTEPWSGSIAHVAIFDRPLSDAEVASLASVA